MYYRHCFRHYRYRKGLHAPVIAGLNFVISGTVECIYVEVASYLFVGYHVMNYEIPVAKSVRICEVQ
jgi:hypothetical protein